MSGHPLADFSPPIAGKRSPLPTMNDMLSEAIIRPARPGDSEAIAALMREGVSDQVRRITILGSPYLARFIADELAGNKNDEYVVSMVRERVVGMCAWKHIDTTLHLNHINVAPDVHGQGLGTAMMLDGLRRIRRTPQRILSTDVFSDTPYAQAWYRFLHLRSEKHVQWIQLPLPSLKPGGNLRCAISGLDEAAADHFRYGFSHVALTTNSASYQVGRLGPDLFRVGTFAILQDPAALQGLAQFDAERQLLCIDSAEDCADLPPGSYTLVAESERLVSSCATVLEHLESSLSSGLRKNLVCGSTGSP
jgi:ribosomal protein S18 acetylase RimI-like enzyme